VIVGLSRIGREIADRLAAFKMDIHHFVRSEKETPDWAWNADPVSLAAQVDYLLVALVGSADTEKFVSARVNEAFGPQGVVVNISRGKTIDEAALFDALDGRRIAGTGLDAFLNKPDIEAVQCPAECGDPAAPWLGHGRNAGGHGAASAR